MSNNIWVTDGPVADVAGFNYPTRMAIIRLSDSSLFIWSPISLTDKLQAEVFALGKVAHIVAPNSLHHMYIPEWQSAFPDAATYAAPRLRNKRKDIRFDDDLGNIPNASWALEIDQVIMDGNLITDEVVFFHIPSGTILFTDLIQQFPDDWFSGWRKIVARFDLMLSSEPAVPRKFRVAFTNRRAARRSLDRVFAWPVEKILMAHGTPVTTDARRFLSRAFSWLRR